MPNHVRSSIRKIGRLSESAGSIPHFDGSCESLCMKVEVCEGLCLTVFFLSNYVLLSKDAPDDRVACSALLLFWLVQKTPGWQYGQHSWWQGLCLGL